MIIIDSEGSIEMLLVFFFPSHSVVSFNNHLLLQKRFVEIVRIENNDFENDSERKFETDHTPQKHEIVKGFLRIKLTESKKIRPHHSTSRLTSFVNVHESAGFTCFNWPRSF